MQRQKPFFVDWRADHEAFQARLIGYPERECRDYHRVIHTESTDDIIGQYILFTHVFDQQVKRYGYTRKAAEETVRICKDKGVLKGYLEAHETEVVNSMIMLFEQEESVKRYGNRMRSEGRAEGRDEGKIVTLCELVIDGMLTIEQAAKKAGMTVEQFKAAVEALKVTA